MQKKYTSIGEEFGISAAGKVKSVVGGGVDTSTVKPNEPTVKVNEPMVKVGEPTVKVDEPTVKPQEPTVKPQEPTVKVDEPTVKTTDTPNGRSTHMDEPEIEPGVVAKEPTADGHEIKVLKDGRVVRCSDCAEIRAEYKAELNQRPDLKARLDQIEQESNPQEKAQQAEQLKQELDRIRTAKTDTVLIASPPKAMDVKAQEKLGSHSTGQAAPQQTQRLAKDEKDLISELQQTGVKITPENLVKIARTNERRIVWLETGNVTEGEKRGRGLAHIMEHAQDFVNRGIPQDQIADAVMTAVTRGKVIGTQGGSRTVYEVVFNGETQYISVSVGSNGFIVGANPTNKRVYTKLLEQLH